MRLWAVVAVAAAAAEEVAGGTEDRTKLSFVVVSDEASGNIDALGRRDSLALWLVTFVTSVIEARRGDCWWRVL